MEEFAPHNDHHYLLREYMTELHDGLTEMLQRSQNLYTLCLSGTQATAFYQLWNLLDIKHDKYATMIVDTLLAKMSRIAA